MNDSQRCNAHHQQLTSKYPKPQVSSIEDLQERKAFYEKTDVYAPLQPGEFACGVTRHPDTGLYQVWLSTNGLDVIPLNAKREKKSAQRDEKAIKAVLDGHEYDERRVALLIEQLATEADEKPQPFPAEIIRQIVRAIRHTLADEAEL